MEDLIKALQIFQKYDKLENSNEPSYSPTGCEHDVLYIYIDPENVLNEDIAELETLGFSVNENLRCFESIRFGSA